jgi:hypothetical protein
VFEGETLASKGLEVEAEIEMSVETGIELSACCLENVLRTQLAAEHLVDLRHRYARVAADRKQGAPGLFGGFRAGSAKEVPGGVLDVVRIHGAVRFELGAAVLVAAGVVERDPALPELGLNVRGELHQVIEASRRLGNSAVLKIRERAIEDPLGTIPR